jgi:hypothetical protein
MRHGLWLRNEVFSDLKIILVRPADNSLHDRKLDIISLCNRDPIKLIRIHDKFTFSHLWIRKRNIP